MQTQQLLHGNFRKTILRYISLNVVSMIGLSLYILADTFFVANGVGSNGIVALNIALPAYSFVNGVGLLLGMGAATRFSIAMGEGQQGGAAGSLPKRPVSAPARRQCSPSSESVSPSRSASCSAPRGRLLRSQRNTS